MATVYSLPPPLGLKLKLSRARKYLRHVQRILDKFEAGNPATLRREINADRTHYVYSFHVGYAPNSVELLVDEALYHLRSVLDHLVAGMVESVGKKVSDDHAFPILRKKTKKPKQKARIRKMLKHVPTEAQAFIDSVQPYQRGKEANAHPLAILAKLNNGFKHKSLHLLTYRLQFPKVPGIITPPASPTGREPGDVFAAVPIGLDVEKHFEPYVSVHVAFREKILDLPTAGLDTINDIYNYVRDEVIRKAIRGKGLPRRI
jgi:hypothetical protein